MPLKSVQLRVWAALHALPAIQRIWGGAHAAETELGVYGTKINCSAGPKISPNIFGDSASGAFRTEGARQL